MSTLDPQVAYYVESRQDRSALIALDAKLTDTEVEWCDTIRDRGFPVEAVTEDDDAIVVRTPRATYRFRPLSLDLYRQKVRLRVDGEPDFSTTEALQRYYQRLTR